MVPLRMLGRIVEESVTKCYLCVETRPSESALAGAKDMFLIHRSLGTNVLVLVGLALLASPAAFVQANDPSGIDASAGGIEFPRVLTSEAGVVVVHGSGFGQKPGTAHFRIVFLPPEDILRRAYAAIGDFAASHQRA